MEKFAADFGITVLQTEQEKAQQMCDFTLPLLANMTTCWWHSYPQTTRQVEDLWYIF